MSQHDDFVTALSSVLMHLYWIVAFLWYETLTWWFRVRRGCVVCTIPSPAHVFLLGDACSRLLGEDFSVGGDVAKGTESHGFCRCSGKVGRHGGDAGLFLLMGPPYMAESPETSEAGRAQVVGGNPWRLRKVWNFEEPHTCCLAESVL